MNAHQFDWPARRAERIVVTSTGVQIGAAYVRPPPLPSRDAEIVQRALLPEPPQPIALHEWVLYAIAAGVVIAYFAGWFR